MKKTNTQAGAHEEEPKHQQNAKKDEAVTSRHALLFNADT
jgi:hypothetical protein